MKTRKKPKLLKRGPNPLRIDPTRTGFLRRRVAAEMGRRFAILKGRLVKMLVVEDAFGLKSTQPIGQEPPTTNQFCPTGPGGGSDPSCGKDSTAHPATQARIAVAKVFAENLKASSLPKEKRQEYADAVKRVVYNLPKAAAERIAQNLAKVTFHDSVREVSLAASKLIKDPDEQRKLVDGESVIGGYYVKGDRSLTLDGGDPPYSSAHEIYAHEVSHAVDGPHYELSRSEEWRGAWASEIKGGNLTKYATTKEPEGFAEFGRLIYGRGKTADDLRTRFPRCTAFMESRGLIESGRTTTTNAPDDLPELFSESYEMVDGSHGDVLLREDSLRAPTVNPFVSEAQHKACYAKDDPAWDCEEWDEAGKKKPTGNMNPNHDEQGRFSSGDESAAKDAATVARKRLDEHEKDRPKLKDDATDEEFAKWEGDREAHAKTRTALIGDYEKASTDVYRIEALNKANEDPLPLRGDFASYTGPRGGAPIYISPIGRAVDHADRSLTGAVKSAVDSYVGHSHASIDAGGMGGGIMEEGLLETILRSDSEVRSQLRTAMEPVRSLLKEKYGETVPLYRFQGANTRGGDRVVLSWTADPKFAGWHGGESEGELVRQDVHIDRIAWATNRANQKEFLVYTNPPTANTRYKFLTSADKLKAFQDWLQQQFKDVVKGDDVRKLWEEFTKQGYLRGAGRVWDDVRQSKLRREKPELFSPDKQDQLRGYYGGSKDEFLRSSFSRPVSVEKVQLLAARSYDELDGVTEEMGRDMSRVLADGLVRGENPHTIAKEMTEKIDITRERAERIAQHEIQRAHSEGQLQALEDMGVEEVGVMVEWTNSGFSKCAALTPKERKTQTCVCKKCAALEGVVMKLSEAKGLLPLHVGCLCAWVPAQVGESPKGQTKSKKGIDSKLEEAGVDDVDVSEDRPESILNNRLTHVLNWCNQYGGTTCRDASKNTEARKQAKQVAKMTPREQHKALIAQSNELGAKAEVALKETRKYKTFTSKKRAAAFSEYVKHNNAQADVDSKIRDLERKEVGRLFSSAKNEGTVMTHGMTKPEQMKSFEHGSIKYTFNDDTKDAVESTLRETMFEHELPPALASATKEIVFTKQENKDDAYWRSKYVNFSKSLATGGNGVVCVYNGQGIGFSELAHEAGHCLAGRLWNGSTSPAPGSAYSVAQAREKPVSSYGANSSSEDFAEACRMYVDRPYTLRTEFPNKYQALRSIFGDDL